jgi:hypothetical protein
MLTERLSAWPSMAIGSPTRSSTRCRLPTHSSAASRPTSSTTNSSPPSRATVSSSRTALADAARHLDQHPVANGMAKAVVDRFEAVEVEVANRQQPLVALGARQRLRQAVEEQDAVGHAGQRVIVGQALELLFVFQARADLAPQVILAQPPGFVALQRAVVVKDAGERDQIQHGGADVDAGGLRIRALDEVAGNDGNDGRRQPPQAGARALEEKGRRRMQEEQRQPIALRRRQQINGEEQDRNPSPRARLATSSTGPGGGANIARAGSRSRRSGNRWPPADALIHQR